MLADVERAGGATGARGRLIAVERALFGILATAAWVAACTREHSSGAPTQTSLPTPSSLSAPRPPATPSSAPEPSATAEASSCAPHDRPTKLYWTEGCCTPVVAKDVVACLSEAERAAVGYVSAELVSHCDWAELPADGARGRLDCPYTSALGFGYQCEDTHREFLRRWFQEDMPSRCSQKPDTAYQQEVLVELAFSTVGSRTTVDYKAAGTTGPGGKSWDWAETLVFEPRGAERMKLVRRTTKGIRPKAY
ncbi:hypothetical protein WME90_25675 [Sorangium sp. So ce375]|uniref:hypothetical protein n=1 Tax=Sorangium sp. So ce375 TaxID=3133306 RepID=UPI003F5B5737